MVDNLFLVGEMLVNAEWEVREDGREGHQGNGKKIVVRACVPCLMAHKIRSLDLGAQKGMKLLFMCGGISVHNTDIFVHVKASSAAYDERKMVQLMSATAGLCGHAAGGVISLSQKEKSQEEARTTWETS